MKVADIANPKGLTETDKCIRHPFIASMDGPSGEDLRRVVSFKCSVLAPERGDGGGSVIYGNNTEVLQTDSSRLSGSPPEGDTLKMTIR